MANQPTNSSSAGVVTYTLKVPVECMGHVLTELKFKQPKLKHFKYLDGAKGNFEVMARLIEKLCGVLPEQIDEIDIQDFDEIGKIIENFSKKSQQT